MPLLILLVLAIGGWAWWTGRLRGFTYEDAVASVLFLLGLRMMTTGRVLVGAALMAGALLWAAHRRRQLEGAAMSPAEARLFLGVEEGASLSAIRDAYVRRIDAADGERHLIARADLARDTLVAEMNKGAPRAS